MPQGGHDEGQLQVLRWVYGGLACAQNLDFLERQVEVPPCRQSCQSWYFLPMSAHAAFTALYSSQSLLDQLDCSICRFLLLSPRQPSAPTTSDADRASPTMCILNTGAAGRGRARRQGAGGRGAAG